MNHAYDAAGRRALTTQTTSRPSGNPNSATALTLSDSYDGDGLGLRRTTTKQVNAAAPTTAAVYYLRSTALDD